MIQILNTTHALEIWGPRRQVWRAARTADERLRPAEALAAAGRLLEAIDAAEEAWIAANGHMRDVAFRVRSLSETFTGKGTAVQLLDGVAVPPSSPP
jgi:hypothetical protein